MEVEIIYNKENVRAEKLANCIVETANNFLSKEKNKFIVKSELDVYKLKDTKKPKDIYVFIAFEFLEIKECLENITGEKKLIIIDEKEEENISSYANLATNIISMDNSCINIVKDIYFMGKLNDKVKECKEKIKK